MFGGFSGGDLDKKAIRPWLAVVLVLFMASVIIYLIYNGR